MTAKELTNDVKDEVTKGIEKLAMLRDEAKLHIHLATLEAKQEWDDKLEPKIAELQGAATHLGESSKEKVHDAVKTVEDFIAKLRGKTSSAS
jgi:hypothetical protein